MTPAHLVAAAAFAVSALIPGPASPAAPTVDLLAHGITRVDGATKADTAGGTVAGVGDVNGDGIPDYAVGSSDASAGAVRTAGQVQIVFGRRSPELVDLKSRTAPGLRILGAEINDKAGRKIAPVGDLNGDGLADVAIAAPLADHHDRRQSGAVYVIYGRRRSGTIRLARLPPDAGFVIDGAAARDFTGISLADAGDVDGDGHTDLLVGAYGANAAGRESAGAAYVIYGRPGAGGFDLAAPGDRARIIEGAAVGDVTGATVAAAGDLDGDGHADLLIGAPMADPEGRTNAGIAWVVFGRAGTDPIDLADPGADAYAIEGPVAQGRLGGFFDQGLAGAGDVDGDGIPDLLVSSSIVDVGRRRDVGVTWVLRGRGPGPARDLARLAPSDGYRIIGAAARQRAGQALLGLGDVNGDGHADVAIGAPGDGFLDKRPDATYVVYGGGIPHPDVDLATLTAATGRWLVGQREDQGGFALGRIPDIDGDGVAELLVGAIGADPRSRGYLPGAAYLVPSRTQPHGLTRQGTEANDVFDGGGLADTLRSGLGDDAVFGGGGNDVVDGQTGDDLVEGGDGDDIVRGGTGRDRLYGGPGDDTIDAHDRAVDIVDCGPGVDTATVDTKDRVTHCEHVTRLRR